MKNPYIWRVLVIIVVLAAIFQANPAFAAAQQSDYLNYQEPKSSGYSWLSTIAYVISLIIMFAVVLALAHYTSRYFGQRMGKSVIAGDNKVVFSLSLGPNRGISVVEIAGKFLVLGITDHNINLLQEITDDQQIEKLKTMESSTANNQFDAIFQRQIISLQQMSQKFPGVFGGNRRGENDERGKR